MANTSNENLYYLLKNDPNRVYVIAEAGFNHGGNKERALALVRAAKWAGADAVKFQMSCADHSACFRQPSFGIAKDQPNFQEQLKKLELSFDTFRALHKEAKRIGIDFHSTPLNEEGADFLSELGVDAFRIASVDVTHQPLIEHVARKGKPVLLSTGKHTTEEIDAAIHWIHAHANDQAALLHCVSSYPAKLEELNLTSLQYLRERFRVLVGFSDHSVGTLASLVATSVGAQIVERHFMIETRGETPDYSVSLDAKTLKTHIEELRKIGTVLGQSAAFAPAVETRKRTVAGFEESLVATQNGIKIARAERPRLTSKARVAHAN